MRVGMNLPGPFFVSGDTRGASEALGAILMVSVVTIPIWGPAYFLPWPWALAVYVIEAVVVVGGAYGLLTDKAEDAPAPTPTPRPEARVIQSVAPETAARDNGISLPPNWDELGWYEKWDYLANNAVPRP